MADSGEGVPQATSADPPPCAEPSPGLPRPAKQLIGFAVVAGGLAVTIATVHAATQGAPSEHQVVVLVALGLLTAANWTWPLLIYWGDESESVHLDEAGVVIMALLVPPGWALLVLVAGTIAAQIIRRRSALKVGFNTGQFAMSAGLALLVAHTVAPAGPHLTIGAVAAAVLGTGVYFVVNTVMITGILAATGTPWRASVFEGMFVRLSLIGSSVAVAVVIALAMSTYRWSIVLAVPVLPMLRRVLSAQFSALHDRTRLRGLLDAMLVVNRNLSRDDVIAEIFTAVRRQLRCPDVRIVENAPETGQLAARMAVGAKVYWLLASGRSHAEPFDAADAALLDTLAAVGGGALTNALLYQQVSYERERLEAITSSLGEGVLAIDTAGRVTFVNPAAAEMLGWSSSGPVTAIDDDVRVDDTLTVPAQLAIAGGHPVRDEDATFFDRQGHAVPVAYTASAIVDEDHPVGAVVAFRDLTDRKAFEAERARTQAERAALEAQLHQNQRLESLGQLAGGVAHDFNNLLGVISNSALFVREKIDEVAAGPSGEEWTIAAEDIGQIEDAVQRAASLTHQLLAFARREVVEPRVIDLNALVTSVEQLLKRSLGEHIELSATLDRDLGPVKVDPGQFEQVMVNLLVNARDAMPNGGTLTVETADVDIAGPVSGPVVDLLPGRYARIRVVDSGTGIPPELLSKVLEPFFTTKPTGAGTGLGLATVYGIVAQAGGHLQIESTVGVGTTMTVLLPVAPSVSTDDAHEVSPSGADGGTILVVEDELALRDVTRRLLERNGYDVLVAANGGDAVRLAERHPGRIDLLLTDLVMPVMLGVEVAERVTQLRPGTKVLYMSGYSQTVLGARAAGADDVPLVEKPFSESTLLAKVHEVLDRHAPADLDQASTLS